jgi:hypothetical protein
MAYPDYKRDLLAEPFDVNFVLDKYFHAGQSAVFHGAGPDEEVRLLNGIATALFHAFHVRVHPLQIRVCGSAHLGFSPVPDKLGKSFESTSCDIDVAVISPEIFESIWNELQMLGLDQAIRQQVSRDLFWGFMNPALIRDISEQGARWWQAFGGIRTDRAAGVRGRLYRSFWSMQSYHRIAIFNGRQKLLQELTATDQN